MEEADLPPRLFSLHNPFLPSTGLKFTKNFIFAQKSGLSPTMCVILPIAAEKCVIFTIMLHLHLFVTGL